MKYILKSDQDRARVLEIISNINLSKPQMVEIKAAESVRSLDQNRLQRLWINEAHEHLGWGTEHIRAYCKLRIGVPILRQTNEEFCKVYDDVIRPLDYEKKLLIMQVPIDLPVTSLMKVKEKAMFLDGMYIELVGLGCILTDPGSNGREGYKEAG